MKIALCGTWHVHAPEYADTVVNTEGAELVGVYEENEAWKKAFAQKYSVKAYDTFEELLEGDADGVIVCSSSDTHADYMVRIAQAKKHIFTEKVLALTVEDCERVRKAVEENGVRFVISLVHKYRNYGVTMKKIADSGELGKINYLRFRNCHSGSIKDWLPAHFYDEKQCGGGAMIDLGAHGMYIADWILGQPEKYTSSFNVWDENPKNAARLEDNAVTIMSYSDGAIAVNETGFVSACDPMVFEISGDKGYAVYNLGKIYKKTAATENKTVEVEPEENQPSPLSQFLSGKVLDGCGMTEALNLTKMMVGAYGNTI